MKNEIVFFVVILFILMEIVWLQMVLSKKENKWLGLVLPFMAFLFGFIFPFNMVIPSEGADIGFVIQVILVWMLGNIPTIILLAIYFCYRGKQNCNKQLDKMNIQDL